MQPSRVKLTLRTANSQPDSHWHASLEFLSWQASCLNPPLASPMDLYSGGHEWLLRLPPPERNGVPDNVVPHHCIAPRSPVPRRSLSPASWRFRSPAPTGEAYASPVPRLITGKSATEIYGESCSWSPVRGLVDTGSWSPVNVPTDLFYIGNLTDIFSWFTIIGPKDTHARAAAIFGARAAAVSSCFAAVIPETMSCFLVFFSFIFGFWIYFIGFASHQCHPPIPLVLFNLLNTSSTFVSL